MHLGSVCSAIVRGRNVYLGELLKGPEYFVIPLEYCPDTLSS